jgi:type I restriction enzyme R subunit
MTTEHRTRKDLIDASLRLAGWNLADPTQVVEEYAIDLGTGGVESLMAADGAAPFAGREFADYALLLRGRVAAVVEAKRTSRDPRVGQEQALQYAQHIQALQGGPIPLVFFTNGLDLWFWDSDTRPPAKTRGYPTPLDLEWLDQRRQGRKPLSVELINTEIAGREYQIAAIRSILERIEARRRRFLLVMATGTGKTRTAMGLIDVLLRAHWAKRVLFLVDRVALRDQAIDAFREHLPGSPYWPRTKGHHVETAWASNRRLYCTTYPSMLSLTERGTTPESYISPYFFDLVIADESHRSIYNSYLAVLDWFSGLRIGLTATPRDHIEHDTFKLFDCDANDPTFAYTFEEAISHQPPWLSDFEVLKVRSKFQLEGIKGGVLPGAVQRKLVAEGKDPAEIDFEGSDLERKVTNSGTNVVIVREFMEECAKDPTGTLPGKSIFFAISMGHARRLAEIFDKLYPEHAGRLARVLVSDDPRVYGKGGLLDQFKHSDMPRVAISVDMLDTGVDVPEVVNLVFAKPVFSYTKFWQMIGRGTRVLPAPHKRKPWCPEKRAFLVIDCWGNFDFFKMHPKGLEPGEQVPLPVRLFHARLDALVAALAGGHEDVVAAVIEDLRADLATLPVNNAVVAEARADLLPLADDGYWSVLTVQRLGFLRTTVAPVLRARPAVEAKAMRFETEAVELVTAMLSGQQARMDVLRESLAVQVSELPLSVNTVAAQRERVETTRATSWWIGATLAQVRDAARGLAPLMRFRQPPREPMMRLDIADLTVVREKVEFGPEHEGLTTRTYRERIEAEVRALVEANPVMARVAAGEEPTGDELDELAAILRGLDPAITPEVLCRVYDLRSARLVRLLRHVLGLERLPSWPDAVTAAFDGFVARHSTLTELQIRFLGTLKTFLLQNRHMERRHLVEAPFTQVHPHGIRGVFSGPDLDEVLAMAEGLVA